GEALATVAIRADDPESGERAEHPLGHRLEADDSRVAVLEERDQFVLAHAAVSVGELGIGVDVDDLLPHGRMAAHVVGGDAQLFELRHVSSTLDESGSRAPWMRSA